MSASVDQRMKGQANQVTNGPKEPGNEEDFDSWRTQSHQNYNTPMSSGMGTADPYMSSYYGMSFPTYQNIGLNDGGAWSNGGDPMTFLGGYGQQMGNEQHSHYMDGMFSSGGFSNFNQASFNYFPGTGDYSAWGNSSLRKPSSHGGVHFEDYYRDMYGNAGGATDPGIKPIEQGMQGLCLDKQDPKMMMDQKLDMNRQLLDGPLQGHNSGPGPKKMSWASVASQPAKLQPKMKSKSIPPAPMLPGSKHNMDIGTWESKNGSGSVGPKLMQPAPPNAGGTGRPTWAAGGQRGARGMVNSGGGGIYMAPGVISNSAVQMNHNVPHMVPNNNNNVLHQPMSHQQMGLQAGQPIPNGPPITPVGVPNPVLDKLHQSNEYNPRHFDLAPKNVRFFIIKSYSEDDIHRSIKYGIWCSTEHGNKRLDSAFREAQAKGGMIYLFFSVNGSGHFCGMAHMASELDYNATSNVWAQDKWKGEFKVKWVYVKDVPNAQLRHIRLENNENKPVTNSRDTQEVPLDKGHQVLKIMHTFQHTTSIFDDFVHYEKRQEEEDHRKHVR